MAELVWISHVLEQTHVFEAVDGLSISGFVPAALTGIRATVLRARLREPSRLTLDEVTGGRAKSG